MIPGKECHKDGGIHVLEDRKLWNQRQKELKSMLAKPAQYENAREFLLLQHGAVHSARSRDGDAWSFEDEVLDHMTENRFRHVPASGANSVAWHIYHSTRIEDMTMNVLVAQMKQVIDSDSWMQSMHLNVRDTGNGMLLEQLVHLSSVVDIPSLRAYRAAVGQRTRDIVRELSAADFRRKVSSEHLSQLSEMGDVLPENNWLLDYWGNLTVAGLFMMPATRHHFVHLNKSSRIRE